MTIALNARDKKVLCLVGPTAVGKTEISLHLAEQLGGEIVSADSRQVYKYLNIGTAKPTAKELARVPHHFIDIREPDQYYSAGEYGREARACIENLFAKEKTPIVVGGSGFYIQALVDGLFAPKISDPDVKEKWREYIREKGNEVTFRFLSNIDPQTAARLHPNDSQRIVRALEVWELSGKPISEFRAGDQKAADFAPVFIGLDRDRQALYERIEKRVDIMIENGLVEEVKDLQKTGFGPHLNALRTVGYKEVFDYLAGEIDFDEMIDSIKRNTRRYAKRQLTWFRRDERIQWILLDHKNKQETVENILQKFS